MTEIRNCVLNDGITDAERATSILMRSGWSNDFNEKIRILNEGAKSLEQAGVSDLYVKQVRGNIRWLETIITADENLSK